MLVTEFSLQQLNFSLQLNFRDQIQSSTEFQRPNSVFNRISEIKFSLQQNFRDQIQSLTVEFQSSTVEFQSSTVEFQPSTEFGRWPNSVFKQNDVNEMKEWKWKIFQVTFLIELAIDFFFNIKFFDGLDMLVTKFSLQTKWCEWDERMKVKNIISHISQRIGDWFSLKI
jgi:hypothetical protein